ncbi:probable protein phosphatase 2C 60 [Solanum pennellii]|uniref:Probable protein phosphatase 2C 60 n=1 Tax=Solanum pennellii TaxID=28526 RepID=A0ABM1VHA3_SOLPN|nr:probable protein phosphatase 2C 60 [Solanum pennellii]
MGIYLSSPKTEKFSEDGGNDRVKYGLSSMQGWHATMECSSSISLHAAIPDLDTSTSFFGVYDGHRGKVVAKFCAKYLHQQVLKHEAYLHGDIGTSVQKAFFRMDEMMRGQRGWRELAALGDKLNKFTGMIEGLIWSPKNGDGNNHVDDWAFEEGPHSNFSGPTSGCTACVAILRENQLVVSNAGDSRCVISRKGQAYNLSRDHKPELEVERERILKTSGFIHAGRVNGSLNHARAIGDMEFKQNKFLPAEKQIVTANPDINTRYAAAHRVEDAKEFFYKRKNFDLELDGFLSAGTSNWAEAKAMLFGLKWCLAPSTAGGEGCDNMTMILVQFKKPFQSGASLVDEELPASNEKLPAPSESTNTETIPKKSGSSS